jgi:hypothetical protein
MEITITQTVTTEVTSTVNVENLKVLRTNSRDIDSTNLIIYYNDVEIGNGHLNNRTNYAHISLNLDNQELEDYLVEAIENRTIYIQ